MMAELETTDADLDTIALRETGITGIRVDDALRTSFEQTTEGNVVSATYAFADGGYGEYSYEIGGQVIKFIESNCHCEMNDQGVVTITARSKGETAKNADIAK